MQPSVSPHLTISRTGQFLVEHDPAGTFIVPSGGIPVWVYVKPVPYANCVCSCKTGWITAENLESFYRVIGKTPTIPLSEISERYVCSCMGRLIE